MTGTTDVGNEPRFVIAAFGSVWSSNYVDGTLSRIDPASGEVTATIETAFGPQIMLEASGELWVSSIEEAVVQRIDPDTEAVVGTVEDVGIVPDGLFPLEGAVGVASDSGPEIRRIDPATGAVTGPWIVADQGSINANQLVLVHGDTLWIPLLESGEVVEATPPPPA